MVISALGCGKKEDTAAEEEVSDSVLYIAETAMSQAGSSASASEGGSVGFMGIEPEAMKYVADFVDPHDSIHPLATACTFSSVRGQRPSLAQGPLPVKFQWMMVER